MTRSALALLLGFLALCHAAPLQAVPTTTPPASGLLLDVTKFENKDGGQITVLVNGASQTYLLTDRTRFEIVRGTEHKAGSALAEHRGETVAVAVKMGSNPAVAEKVQVILPVPPAAALHPALCTAQSGHVHGTVVHLGPGTLTIHLHHFHHKPPPPVLGSITDVSQDPNSGLGYLTLQVNGQPVKFVVNPATYFEKVQGGVHKPSSFLAEHKGEMALIHPRYGQANVAGRVAIMLPGGAPAKTTAKPAAQIVHHPHEHLLHYALTPQTKFGRVREGHHQPSTLAALAVGEAVSVMATGVHSHVAATVDVQLPHAIHGQLVNATASALTLKVHHKAENGQPAQETMRTIPLLPATQIHAVDGKTHKPAAATGLKGGEHVVVFPAALPPHPAEAVEIHVKHVDIKPVTVKGALVGLANGALVVKVHHAAHGDKPAHEALEHFRLGPATSFHLVQGKDHKPATPAALVPGEQVVVHGHTGDQPTAEKVEIHLKAQPKPKNPPPVKPPAKPPAKPK